MESSSSALGSYLLTLSSLLDRRVQIIPRSARRKTRPAAIAIEIRITTPVARKSGGERQLAEIRTRSLYLHTYVVARS